MMAFLNTKSHMQTGPGSGPYMNLAANTVWAADFETPVGSSTFFSFFHFSWAASAEINNK
jgi:hypothetical protein